jgi:opacity protein-like surface antigen
MRALKISLLAGALLFPVAAQAADIEPVVPETEAMGLYLRADAGVSFLEWSGGDDDVGGVFGGGIGYRYNDNMRADITVDWAGKYDVAPGASMSTVTVLGNLYYDFANDSAFTPYIGAGAGYGWVNSTPTGNESGLAVNLAAGVAVDLTQNIALDVGYRFRDTFISGANPIEHQVTAGLRFSF